MRDFAVPTVSSSVGIFNDGLIRGNVARSTMISAVANLIFADVYHLVRRDTTPTGSTYIASISDVTAGIFPFGGTGAMSATDRFYFACHCDVSEIFVRMKTQGNWVGTGIEIFDSTDGKRANRQLLGVVDDSNGFRNAAGQIYRIVWTDPGAANVAWTPSVDDVAERRWFEVRLKDFTGVTTAPEIDILIIKRKEDVEEFTEFTSYINVALTDGDFGAFASLTSFLYKDEAIYHCLPALAYGLDVAMWRALTNVVPTKVWEYLASDGTWKLYENLVDETNAFCSGPATLGATAELKKIRWTIPTDWVSMPHSHLVGSTTHTDTGFWQRHRTTAVSAYLPVPVSLTRVRARCLGERYRDWKIEVA